MIRTFHVLDSRSNRFLEKTGWFVVQTEEDLPVTGVAMFPPSGKITVEGEVIIHSQWGQQFKSTRVFYDDPVQIMVQLFGSGFLKGVKKSKAVALVKALGQDCFMILDACVEAPTVPIPWNGMFKLPWDILMSTKGIKQVVAKQVVGAWEAKRERMAIAILAIRVGFTPTQYHDAIGFFGESELQKTIMERPYDLTMVDSISFHDADVIAQLEWEGKPAIALDSPQRMAAGLREVVNRQKENGHMCWPVEEALREAEVLLDFSANDIWEILENESLDDLGLVVIDTKTISLLATKQNFQIELDLANKLKELMSIEFKGIPSDLKREDLIPFAEGMELTEQQWDAIWMALHENVCIWTGGPGTGKSTITKVLLNILDGFHINYELVAFIAKVAIRLREITGRDAGTIHSFFELFKDVGDRPTLYNGYLIIDESSTNNVELMHDALMQVFTGCRVVMIGDSNQLPPIGPGEPFTQLQESLPTVTLNQIFRQAETSGIVVAAHEILKGNVPMEMIGNDFWRITADKNKIADLVRRSLFRINETRNIPLEEIQVLVPIHGSPIGRTALNRMLQNALNPHGTVVIPGNYEEGILDIRMGDRVIHTKNLPHVKNGEVGYVVKSNIQQQPDGSFDLIDDSPGLFDEQPIVLWVQYPFHNEPTGYNKDQVKLLNLAYAITVHKAIGSEYQAVILVLPWTRAAFMSRQIPYTGETRPKKMCVIISEPGALEAYLANNVRQTRYSALGILMEE